MTDKRYIFLHIDYNWPPTKFSISGFRLSPYNAKFSIRVLAENRKKPGEFYTFNEIVEDFHNVDEVSKLFSESASKGRYLTGDIFYIEVKNNETGLIKRMKINALENKPSNAIGPTHVNTQYSLEI